MSDSDFTWEYDELQGGGERWRLMRYGVTLGCVVRLPLTMSRVYARGEVVGDFTTRKEATAMLALQFNADVERAPCV